MTYIANSIEARDIASLVHMQTNLRRHQQEGPLVIARGEGCRVFDDSGRDYIESVAGLWCASLGFNSERLARVAHEQMRRLGYYHLYRHRSNEPAIELAEALLKIAPVPMARVVFQCSGSEANDTAIKLAWYYWNAVGKPQRTKIIARHMAYHGNTCAAVSLSGKPDMHAGFGLPFSPFKHTEFPHYYRRHEQGETELAFSDRMAQALETLIQLEGPDTIAAFFAEPVMGAGGVIVRPGDHGRREVAVVHRPLRDDWSFPKGKLEPGEEFEECALREVTEETGLICQLGRFVGHTQYRDRKDRPKVVAYWIMELVGGTFRPNEEVDELRWVSLGEAEGILSYDRDRELLLVVGAADELSPE